MDTGTVVPWSVTVAVTWSRGSIWVWGPRGNRTPTPNTGSVPSMPSDREQAALEKTNIYSSNGRWHRLFPATGDWLTPWAGHDKRRAGRQADVPADTSCPERDSVFEMGTACSKVPSCHLTSACAPSWWGAHDLPSAVGQPCEKVHPCSGPVFLAFSPRSHPWGLRKCAWNNPSGQAWSWSPPCLPAPAPSSFTSPGLTLPALEPGQAIYGVGGRLALGAPLSPAAVCSLSP